MLNSRHELQHSALSFVNKLKEIEELSIIEGDEEELARPDKAWLEAALEMDSNLKG